MSNKTFYCIRPRQYRVIDDDTRVRMSREDERALNTMLKERLKHGRSTTFKTEQDALNTLNDAGLSLDDYSVNETSSISLGW